MKNKTESFKIVKPSYKMEPFYIIQDSTLIFDEYIRDADHIEKLEIPEGIKYIEGSLAAFTSLKELVFPSTLSGSASIDITGMPQSIRKVDFSKMNEFVITRGLLSHQGKPLIRLKEIVMPKDRVTIHAGALEGTGIRELILPKDPYMDLEALKGCPFLKKIHVPKPKNSFVGIAPGISFEEKHLAKLGIKLERY
jgi:hypothetical protein